MSTDRRLTSVRFPDAIHERLKAAAEERGVSMNFLVVAAMRDFLPRLLSPEELRLTRRDRA